jgi:dolichol-phosphate mannosyltransferase
MNAAADIKSVAEEHAFSPPFPAGSTAPPPTPRATERPRVSVILPTYNERECLRQLSGRLAEFLRAAPSECIVVDDNSPDRTGELVLELGTWAPFQLISRPGKMGLASAVLKGIDAARGEVIVVMDADGSHPPELLPLLVQPVLTGASEFSLASRRITGGADRSLDRTRRLISLGATVLARPLTRAKDPMSGYFAFRREILDRAPLKPTGFKIGLEILAKCRPRLIVEIPFSFGRRLAGVSKLGVREIREYLLHIGRLYRWWLLGR